MMMGDNNYVPLFGKLLRKHGIDKCLEVVQKNRPHSASVFYEIHEIIQGWSIKLLGTIEITPDEQQMHRTSSNTVDDFLRLRLKEAGVAIP
jgi:hypothetical protein